MNNPKPTLETMASLYAEALKLEKVGNENAMKRVRECIERHGYDEDAVVAVASSPDSN